MAISMVDLTTLEGADTPGKVRSLCRQGHAGPTPTSPTCPPVAAVCVYRDLVGGAREALRRRRRSASPPSPPRSRAGRASRCGQARRRRGRRRRGRRRDRHGDRPRRLPRRPLRPGVRRDRRRQGGLRRSAHLKVILETGELAGSTTCAAPPGWRMLAGGDFIKTSTGKISPAATLPVVHGDAARPCATAAPATGERSASSRPAASARPRTRSSTSSLSTRPPAPDWLTPDLVPLRRLQPAQRPAAAAAEAPHRATTPPRLRHDRLSRAMTMPRRRTVRPRPRVARRLARPSQPILRPVHRRRVRRRRRRAVEDGQPGHRGGARRGRRGARPTSTARSPPPAGRTRRLGPDARRRARPSTCSASPGSSRSAPASSPSWRRWTTASRSASRATSTCPLAAAHFFYHAGWADKLELRGARPAPAAARRGRAGDPVELPAADGGVEGGARAGDGQHRRAQARRDHAADRAGARRDRR